MKVLLLNGSPRREGNTHIALAEVAKGEATQDAEGLQTMRVLGRNMGWLLKSIHQSNIAKPPAEIKIKTNMIK